LPTFQVDGFARSFSRESHPLRGPAGVGRSPRPHAGG
jgi:hypothetical protein